jgi:nucleoside-diphosphate-sugar epimerase
MKTLVTGGGGFLGRYVVEQLLERGDEVRVLGRSRYPEVEALGAECVQADVTDADAVAAACEGRDVVFHVAALAGIWGDYDRYFQPNVVGTRNVLAGCRAQGVPKLVHTSSPSVVFDGTDMEGVDESVPYAEDYPAPYPATKKIAEQEVLAANGPDLATVALRPHLIWGPRDNHILPRILARARSGRLRIIGDGTNKVSVTYVENGARAHLQACDVLEPGSAVAGKAYFIGQAEPVQLWDFINRLLEGFDEPPLTRRVSVGFATGVGAVLEGAYKLFGARSEPPMTRFMAHELATSHWFDLSAARRDFGYDPEAISTEEGLRRLFAFGEG